MALTKTVDVRRGMVLKWDGQLWRCLERTLHTPGNLRSILHLTLEHLTTGVVTDVRVHPDDKVDVAFLDTRSCSYSYRDGADHVFVDGESYDQVVLPDRLLGDALKYLRENDAVRVTFHEGRAVALELPKTVGLVVTETEPVARGATAAAQTKAATCDTGLVVQVPAFVAPGDCIEVRTEDGAYLRRVRTGA
jgi:elongation factor P